MAKKKVNKSNTQLIVDTLLTGTSLRSRDISRLISKAAGREVKIQDVASMLSKLSDSKKCDLGHFIQRVKDGTGFVYNMADEARELSEKQAYGLTLKTGPDKYPLAQALKDFPGLSQYTESGKAKSKPQKKAVKKPVRPAKTVKKPAVAKKTTLVPQKAVESSAATIPAVTTSGDKAIELLLGKIIQKAAESGNLNVNLKVSVKLEEED